MRSSPNLFIVAAPSGGGKTSLVAALLERDPGVRLSVSHTTRAPRPGERNGEHYHFVDEATFLQLVSGNAFLEYARVYGHYYGTGRAPVEHLLNKGFNVMLDIDWQGARQVKSSFPGCCSIYILPPSMQELRERLARRGQDSPDVIENRMQEARSEIAHCMEFDFLVINNEFAAALEDLMSIVRVGRPVRPGPKEGFESLLADLLKNV
jgi:guanylate kinase